MYMKENVQKDFTNEEIDKFIEDLNNAVGSKEKVNELLGIKNLPIFIAYLRRIGVKTELLEYAAVVDLTRLKVMREFVHAKSPDDCKVTDKGIEYKGWNVTEKIEVDENGVFRLSDSEYFTMPNEKGEVYLNEDRKEETKVKRKINKYGIADLEYYVYGSDGWYTEERKMDGEIPYILIDETDGATYGYTKKVVDFGQPVFVNGVKSNFEENYYTYTSLFPRSKVWYDSYYWLADKDISEFSKRLDDMDILYEIEREESNISEYERYCTKRESRITERKIKLGKLIAFLKTIKAKSPVGNEVATKILDSAKTVKRSECDKVSGGEDKKEEGKKINQKDREETLQEKLERLRKKSEELRMRLKKLDADEEYYNKVIGIIEKEITDIPLIGRRILSVANKYKVNCDQTDEISFDD